MYGPFDSSIVVRTKTKTIPFIAHMLPHIFQIDRRLNACLQAQWIYALLCSDCTNIAVEVVVIREFRFYRNGFNVPANANFRLIVVFAMRIIRHHGTTSDKGLCIVYGDRACVAGITTFAQFSNFAINRAWFRGRLPIPSINEPKYTQPKDNNDHTQNNSDCDFLARHSRMELPVSKCNAARPSITTA